MLRFRRHFPSINGHEQFTLTCPSTTKLPYVMIDDIMQYFIMWQSTHLYRVENDYTLTLLAPSPEALQYGLKAPERVWPDASLLKKLQAVIKQGTPSDIPKEIGQTDAYQMVRQGFYFVLNKRD
jgi:hypothetical protein